MAYSVPLLETAGSIKNASEAGKLFTQLQHLIRQRNCPFFLGHLRAHSGLPGPLVKGNELADLTTRPNFPDTYTFLTLNTDNVLAAQNSHRLHHLNARTLCLLHKITREQARQVVKDCPSCATHLPVPHLGVNPRGLIPNALWQMDVTHIPEFGNLKYVHVIIDTCSGFIYASLQTGEATKHVISHLLIVMSVLGCPQQIKTDNDPGYTSSGFAQFCTHLNIQHVTGIPYNSQGQGIVERAHLSLKLTINKIKRGNGILLRDHPKISYIMPCLFSIFKIWMLKDNLQLLVFGTLRQKIILQWSFGKIPWTTLGTDLTQFLFGEEGQFGIYPKEMKSARWLPERLVKQINQEHEIINNQSKQARVEGPEEDSLFCLTEKENDHHSIETGIDNDSGD